MMCLMGLRIRKVPSAGNVEHMVSSMIRRGEAVRRDTQLGCIGREPSKLERGWD